MLPPARFQARTHILTVDVEDYFQVEAFAADIPSNKWDQYPSRVTANTLRLLDIFDEYKARATFFVLGWVADRFPGLIGEISRRGHELACHSYWHRCIYRLEPGEFASDTEQAKNAIEQASGAVVRGYRAPSWSITRDSVWALDILAEQGFCYDSSIYPIHHDIYGLPGARLTPYVHHLNKGVRLQEFPPATVNFMGFTLPAAGGGYLRLLPFAYTAWAIRRMQAIPDQRVVVYLHPWEIDPEQPRIASRLRSRFRHYTNLRSMERKLRRLLAEYRFQPFSAVQPLCGEPCAEAPGEGVHTASAGLREEGAPCLR